MCLELLHRQKTYKALVSIVLMCGTLKKYTQKGWGERVPPESKTVGPLSLQACRPTWDSLFLLILLRQRQWRLEGALNISSAVDEDQDPLELHVFYL